MTRARVRVLAFTAVAIVVAAVAFALFSRPAARSAAERPKLLLLTGLPLVFGDDFSLHETGSPALQALQRHYQVVPISVSSDSELAKGRLLLMAQPRAQPAEDLVALDDWVRGGGRVLLLADPMLEWPSSRALGDPLRPPPMFSDTGLLMHWGLRLDAPDTRGPERGRLGGYNIATVSPGVLVGGCAITSDRLVARCRIGKGRATIVADADLLDPAHAGGAAGHNLDALVGELAALDRR
jgi:hypothetical protein